MSIEKYDQQGRKQSKHINYVYSNGEKKILKIANYLNDERHGQNLQYNYSNSPYRDDTYYLYSDEQYVNGTSIKSIHYHNNGQIASRRTYNIKGSGFTKKYFENGQLREEINYLNGYSKHGKYLKYNVKGILLIECNYSNGSKKGKYKEYDNTGNLVKELDYE